MKEQHRTTCSHSSARRIQGEDTVTMIGSFLDDHCEMIEVIHIVVLSVVAPMRKKFND